MKHDLPKALIPVGGVPMILRELAVVRAAGFKKIIVVVGYQAAQVKKVVGKRAQFVIQKKQLGTGHAVGVTKRILRGKTNEVLVLYADSPLVSEKTLRDLVQLRRKTKAVLTLVTIAIPDFRGSRRVFLKYGRIVRDTSGKYLQSCVEYNNATRQERAIKEVNSGFYCFDAKWLWESLPKLKKKPISGEYYLTDLMGLAVAEGKRVAPLPLKHWQEGLGANTMNDISILEKTL